MIVLRMRPRPGLTTVPLATHIREAEVLWSTVEEMEEQCHNTFEGDSVLA